PPALPPDSAYTRFYCEENVFLLARALHPRGAWDVFAVFLSNPPRSVALWSQAASPRADGRVVWDYHVVLALRPRDAPTSIDSDSESQWQSQCSDDAEAGAGVWIYDFDTRLGVPCRWPGA
ncbi:hypothetical protein FA95DRAFT_1469657, partial [Auriscalpium vulgare]